MNTMTMPIMSSATATSRQSDQGCRNCHSIDKLESEPGLVVDFMKKHVGKKLQEWVDNGVEGANTLVDRFSSHMRQKEQTSKDAAMPDVDFL